MRRTLFAISCVIASGLVASWCVASALVAPAPCVIGDPPLDLNATSFTVVSQSGSTISGWHTRPVSSDGVVVLLHGIRSSRLSMLERARMLHDAGYATVMIDFQAHGESPGTAITIGHLERHDVRAAVEFARQQHPNEHLGVLGVSLGGAAALLASPLKIDALVIESAYPDIRDALHNRLAMRLGPLSPIAAGLLLLQLKPRLGISPSDLRPIAHLPDVGCPVFIISGAADQHTTASETRAMFAVAPKPKELWLVEGAAHVDLLQVAPTQCRDKVIGFLDRYLRGEREATHEPSRPSEQ